ncbi:hypothetical protein ebA2556 [Aromatoleum aromaticum EbN1]|uniref:Uncharacterized protein n=1 Tax=Aromatoleum aromaticum (strain DSM 19018 / LMG 30748 / EbN1) TaxID=76114 RepID=Q5P546_AROAE|nr:hypothetical protein ebA2556 [Aromatoleum aromaticum EbN1]
MPLSTGAAMAASLRFRTLLILRSAHVRRIPQSVR